MKVVKRSAKSVIELCGPLQEFHRLPFWHHRHHPQVPSRPHQILDTHGNNSSHLCQVQNESSMHTFVVQITRLWKNHQGAYRIINNLHVLFKFRRLWCPSATTAIRRSATPVATATASGPVPPPPPGNMPPWQQQAPPPPVQHPMHGAPPPPPPGTGI